MESRIECSPRIIKRINIKEQTANDALKYAFYRQINHLSIIRLDNEADKLNYSSWLTRLDNDNTDLKIHLIKILFISLRSDKSFQIFLKPPPDDLNDLELMSDNTMDMVKYFQDNNITDEPLTNEDREQETKHRRSAAVATNMRSYTTIKTSPYFVQSFYVRSDFPIYTWYNPTSIRLPSSFDHNQWELYLNRFHILTENKESNNKHRNECDDIIPIDQISKEVTTSFNWHPYSVLNNEINRPKRTAGSIEIDVNIANQQCNQREIDDAAFSIVSCKVFPGYKLLNIKKFSILLTPDAKFVFKMTGVRLVNYANLNVIKDEHQPNACQLRQRKRVTEKKNSCGKDNDDSLCKKKISSKCSKPQLPSSTDIKNNTKQVIQIKPSTTNTVSTANKNMNTTVNTDFTNLNTSYQECAKRASGSRCPKESEDGAKETKTTQTCGKPKEADSNKKDDGGGQPKEQKKCTTVLNAGRSSLDDSSKCDWTVSSVELSVTQSRAPERPCAPAVDCNVAAEHVGPENRSPRRTAESGRAPPEELPRRRRFVGGQHRASSGQRRSAPASRPDDRNRSCPAASFPEQLQPAAPARRADASSVTFPDTGDCTQRRHQQPQPQPQPQQPHPGPCDNGSASAAAADWDPDVSSYAAFSDRRFTVDDRSRFLTSERTIDDRGCRPAVTARARPPVNDYRANDRDGGGLSDDSSGSDWSAETGISRSFVRSVGRSDDSGSLSTLTSGTSSIEMRLAAAAARCTGHRDGNAAARRRPAASDDDRYPFEGDGGWEQQQRQNDMDALATPSINDVTMQDYTSPSESEYDEYDAVADVWRQPRFDLDDVSMPGSMINSRWSLPSSRDASGSGRLREIGDESAPDAYNTSCSEGNNASGRDDYDDGDDRPHNTFGGFETVDGGEVAPPRRRSL